MYLLIYIEVGEEEECFTKHGLLSREGGGGERVAIKKYIYIDFSFFF